MARYATNTDVSAARSRDEIERTLQRYGASGFMYGWKDASALIAFQLAGRQVRFILPLPDQKAREFTHTPARDTPRSPDAALAAWEQACRQRWRALALAIKAKLEAVECGIVTFDQEFLAHFVAPDGRSIGDHLIPQLDSGQMPVLRLR